MRTVKYFLLIVSGIFFFVNSNAQNKKFEQLTEEEYQKHKAAGNLPVLYPKQFPKDKIIISKNNKVKEVPKTGLVYTSNKSSIYKTKALTNSNCNYVFGYEPPILVPDTDLNGDVVTDTIVEFWSYSGNNPSSAYTAPEYRNDDGSSKPQSLPFTFCFYGDTLSDSLYVNNNGNISFGARYSTFSGVSFPSNLFTMIAPFWGDVDTRNTGSNVVYMRRMPHYAIFKWHKVGYFSSQADKLNSFMLVLTDGTDIHLPNGLNVGFFYDDMQWTTGGASGGTNGFGGTPATVGANKGDGTNFLQFGQFDQPGITYDGPQNNADGVDWLDDQTFVFSSCTNGNNIAPIMTGITVCDTLNACIGDTLTYNIGFLGPEPNDSVSIFVLPPPGVTSFSYTIDSISDPSNPVISINYVATDTSSTSFQIWSGDSGSPPLYSDTVTVTITGREVAGSFTTVDGCAALNNGVITYLPTLGLAPYSISIDGGFTYVDSLQQSSLAGGVYDVVATDNHGCSIDSLITLSPVTGPNSVLATDTSLCIGNSITFIGGPVTTGATYIWTDAAGNNLGSNLNLNINNITINDFDTYFFTIVDSTGCPGTPDGIALNQFLGPQAVLGNDMFVCLGNSITLLGGPSLSGATYNWIGPNNNPIGNGSINITIPSVGSSDLGTYSLSITTNNCTGNSDNIQVSSLIPSVTLSGGGIVGKNNTVCPPSAAQVTFSFGGGSPPFKVTYNNSAMPGSFNDSTTTTNYNVPFANISEGAYQVTQVINGEGCITNNPNNDSVVIRGLSYDLIFDNFLATCGIADGKIISLVSSNLPVTSPKYDYTWTSNKFTTTNDTVKHPNILSIKDSVFNVYGGIYNLQIKDIVGCLYSEYDTLLLKKGIIATLQPETLECESPYIMKFTNATIGDTSTIQNYVINYGDGSGDSTMIRFVSPVYHRYFTQLDTTYMVVFTVNSNIEDLCDDYDTVFIKVNATPNVKLFNVLTPDGDKANSIFRINPTGLYEIDCTIFDRWGTKVTTFNRASNIDWDGAIWNANEAEPGTYYYVLTYRTRQDSVSKTFTETNFIQVVK
jgi:gliding motility-associated-like protein